MIGKGTREDVQLSLSSLLQGVVMIVGQNPQAPSDLGIEGGERPQGQNAHSVHGPGLQTERGGSQLQMVGHPLREL